MIMIGGSSRPRDPEHVNPVRRLVISLLVVMFALTVQQTLHPHQAAAAPVPITASSVKVTEVTAADYGTCALKQAGDAICWGGYANEASPEGTGPLRAISASSMRNCGIQQDGEHHLLGWRPGP